MHQANMNPTFATRGAARFGLVSWERPIHCAVGNHSPAARRPLGKDAKRRIFSQCQNGEPIEALAKRFHRSPACILRMVQVMRAERIAELPLDFIPNRRFSRILRAKAEQSVLGPPPDGERAPAGGGGRHRVPRLTVCHEHASSACRTTTWKS